MVKGLSSNDYFMQFDKVRGTSIEGLLKKMYEHNFVEAQLQHKISIMINCQGMTDF